MRLNRTRERYKAGNLILRDVQRDSHRLQAVWLGLANETQRDLKFNKPQKTLKINDADTKLFAVNVESRLRCRYDIVPHSYRKLDDEQQPVPSNSSLKNVRWWWDVLVVVVTFYLRNLAGTAIVEAEFSTVPGPDIAP